MNTSLRQVSLLLGLFALLSDCRPSGPSARGAIIDTAIPNGLVPGSALTLKGRHFTAVQSVEFANTSVPAGAFLRSGTGELTVKVPANTQSGPVRVATEAGPGQSKQMQLLTGADPLNPGNISTNVPSMTQGYYSDACSPEWFAYCLRDTLLVFYNGHRGNLGGNFDCDRFKFTTEPIGGALFNVYKERNDALILRCELNRAGGGFTGFVIVDTPDGQRYFGNVLRNGNISAFSGEGSRIELCKAALVDAFLGAGDVPIGSPGRNTSCTKCP